MIPVEKLSPHPDNPRKDLGDLWELVDSIRASGILQNLTVIPGDGDRYTVVIGHRRLAAAKKAGLSEVPCVIREMSPEEQLATMMAENVQRHDLTPWEQIQGVQRMVQLGMGLPEIAKKTGIREKTVRRDAKIARDFRPETLQKTMAAGITIQDLVDLQAIDDEETRNAVLSKYGQGYSYGSAKTQALYEQNARKFRNRFELLMAGHPVTEMKKQSDRWNGLYEVVKTWSGLDALDDFQMPDLKPGRTYVWCCEGLSAGVYRYNEAMRAKLDQAKLTDQRMRIMQEDARQINGQVQSMREAFIRGLGVGTVDEQARANLLILDTLYGRNFMSWCYNVKFDWHAVARMLGLNTDNLTPEERGNMWTGIDRWKIPHRRCAAAMAVALSDWDGNLIRVEHGRFVPAPVAAWDQVYGVLVELGYEISPLERALMNGTAEIYRRNDAEEAGA